MTSFFVTTIKRKYTSLVFTRKMIKNSFAFIYDENDNFKDFSKRRIVTSKK